MRGARIVIRATEKLNKNKSPNPFTPSIEEEGDHKSRIEEATMRDEIIEEEIKDMKKKIEKSIKTLSRNKDFQMLKKYGLLKIEKEPIVFYYEIYEEK